MGISDIEVNEQQFEKAKPLLEEAVKLFSSIQVADVDNIKNHAQILLQKCNSASK